MKSNYKKLGDYIRQVDKRNKDLDEIPLLGVSVKKIFIPSIANTVGTDFTKYKIVKKRQFTYIPDTSRRGEKIGIAMLEGYEKALVSQAYTVFEIIDQDELNSDYLMMWFRRPEFDRYARVKSHGSVREIFDWQEMCEVELPIPSIEKQRAIVNEYNTVVNRIQLNEQLNQKLEETAQAVYKQWFVDFEFPAVTSSGVEMPYKSSGGKMVWNEELGKEIPEGWEVKSFTSTLKLTGGGTPNTDNYKYWNGTIPFFTPADISKSYYSIETAKSITELGLKESSTKLYPKNTIFITARGTVGAIGLSSCEMAMNQSCYAIKDKFPYYIHQLVLNVIDKLKSEAVGAVFSALVTKDFDQQFVLDFPEIIKSNFNTNVSYLYELLLNKTLENQKLTQLQSLLLSRLSVGEVK